MDYSWAASASKYAEIYEGLYARSEKERAQELEWQKELEEREQKRLEAEAAAQEAAERAAQKAAEAAGDVQITDADGEVGRFCGGCGAPLAEGQKFCGSCGKPADDVK